MVRWPGRYGVWLLVGALAVLLATLAALQYHWTGEIGRAEADRQRARLERASQRFSRELGRELGQTMGAFRPAMPGRGAADPRVSLLQQLERWRSSERSDLVSRLVLVTPSSSGPVTEAASSGEGGFTDVPFPAQLEPLRRQLEGLVNDGRSSRTGRPDTLLTSPPGFLMPVLQPSAGRPSGFGPGALRLTGVALVELSEAYLRDVLFPELAENHFGPLDEGDYAVAVLSRRDDSLLYGSDPDLRPDELARPDVRLDLSAGPGWLGSPGDAFDRRFRSGGRPTPAERMRGRRPGRPGSGPVGPEAAAPADAGNGQGPPRPVRDWRGDGGMRGPGGAGSPWVLLVRHRGGSLAEAVAAVRRRNLAVGLGVLTLLGGAAVLLAVGGQRARHLAHQQLEFVAGVTHELHTPLAAMRSAGQNLADGVVSDPEKVRRYGELIQKEGTRLSALVAQVLDFAGIESGSSAYASEPVSVATLVGKVVGDMTLVLEQAGVTVEIDVPENLRDIRGDADALRRALENLIANATKFAREGGWIGIGARLDADGRTVALRVEDRGPGIPRSERRRVFEPFYRGADARQHQSPGSGLGLSLVRHVAEAHGGRVSVDARDGGGAVVVLELPAAKDRTEGSA